MKIRKYFALFIAHWCGQINPVDFKANSNVVVRRNINEYNWTKWPIGRWNELQRNSVSDFSKSLIIHKFHRVKHHTQLRGNRSRRTTTRNSINLKGDHCRKIAFERNRCRALFTTAYLYWFYNVQQIRCILFNWKLRDWAGRLINRI